MSAAQETPDRIRFSVVFEGVVLSDEQQKKIEDALVRAVRTELVSLQLSQRLETIKASDMLSPEGVPDGPHGTTRGMFVRVPPE